MKICVCIKYVSIASKYSEFIMSDSDVDPVFLEHQVNEADFAALVEALRLRDEFGEAEVVVVSVGDEKVNEGLRACLALGADRAIRIYSNAIALHDPISVARALASVIRSEDADIIMCGVQSIDAGYQSTGPIIASSIERTCVSVASKIIWTNKFNSLKVHRDFEGGLVEVLEVDLPVVITVLPGINEMRYPSFKDTIRAKKMEIQLKEPQNLVVSQMKIKKVFFKEVSRKVQMLEPDPKVVALKIIELVREAH